MDLMARYGHGDELGWIDEPAASGRSARSVTAAAEPAVSDGTQAPVPAPSGGGGGGEGRSCELCIG